MKAYTIPSIQSEDFSKLHFFKSQGTCNIGADLIQISDANLCGAGSGGIAAFCLSGSEDLSDALEGNIINFLDGQTATIESCINIDKGASCPGGLFYLCNITGISGSECIESLDCPDGSEITSCGNTSGCDNLTENVAVQEFQAAS